jgi:hypothetical protein
MKKTKINLTLQEEYILHISARPNYQQHVEVMKELNNLFHDNKDAVCKHMMNVVDPRIDGSHSALELLSTGVNHQPAKAWAQIESDLPFADALDSLLCPIQMINLRKAHEASSELIGYDFKVSFENSWSKFFQSIPIDNISNFEDLTSTLYVSLRSFDPSFIFLDHTIKMAQYCELSTFLCLEHKIFICVGTPLFMSFCGSLLTPGNFLCLLNAVKRMGEGVLSTVPTIIIPEARSQEINEALSITISSNKAKKIIEPITNSHNGKRVFSVVRTYRYQTLAGVVGVLFLPYLNNHFNLPFGRILGSLFTIRPPASGKSDGAFGAGALVAGGIFDFFRGASSAFKNRFIR